MHGTWRAYSLLHAVDRDGSVCDHLDERFERTTPKVLMQLLTGDGRDFFSKLEKSVEIETRRGVCSVGCRSEAGAGMYNAKVVAYTAFAEHAVRVVDDASALIEACHQPATGKCEPGEQVAADIGGMEFFQ